MTFEYVGDVLPNLWKIDSVFVKAPYSALADDDLRQVLTEAAPDATIPAVLSAQSIGQVVDHVAAARGQSLWQRCVGEHNPGEVAYAFANAMTPVVDLADVPIEAFGQTGLMELAGNEYESIQLVLGAASQRIEGIFVSVEPGFHDLRNDVGHVIETAQISYGLVRDVGTMDHSVGKSPDWISPMQPFTLEPGQIQRLWITVKTRKDQPPGLYRGRIHLRSGDGRHVLSVPLHVQVWNFSLPTRMHMNTVLGWGTDRNVMLEHHYSPGGGSTGTGAIIEPRYLLKDDGTIDIDFAEYDHVIADCRAKGLTVFGLPLNGNPPGRMRKTFINPRTGESKLLSMYPDDGPEAQQRLARFISIFTDHLRERGWLADAFLYIWDEAELDKDEKIVRIGRIVRQACPDLKILIVANPRPSLDEVIDIYVPGTGLWIDAQGRQSVQRARGLGKQIWWYTCGNPYPVAGYVAIGLSPTISRIQFWMNWRYRVPGTLYWAANTNIAFGDGKLHYPDLSPSARLVMIREGIEDYEYFHLLDELTKAQPQHPARALLDIPTGLIESVRRYETHPEPYLSHRRKMAAAIEQRISRAAR